MKSSSQIVRTALAVLCVGAVVASSGCNWLRSRNSAYQDSPQTRPLEVPPDLDMPATDPAMQIPEVAAGAGTGAGAPPAAADEVRVQDTAASTWRRVGLALERIEGATIEERAELLSLYTVRYRGESFLLRVQPDGEAARVTAVSSDGTQLSGGAAAALLGALRQRLG